MFPFHKHSGHCYFGDPIPGSGVIPDTYVPVCPNPMKPPIPSEIPDNKFVTKRELNEILNNIAEADLFEDTSETGTTVSVGGIEKGTKFDGKLTFVEFIKKFLYPVSKEVNEDDQYVTYGQLKQEIDSLKGTLASNYLTTDKVTELVNQIIDSKTEEAANNDNI